MGKLLVADRISKSFGPTRALTEVKKGWPALVDVVTQGR